MGLLVLWRFLKLIFLIIRLLLIFRYGIMCIVRFLVFGRLWLVYILVVFWFFYVVKNFEDLGMYVWWFG